MKCRFIMVPEGGARFPAPAYAQQAVPECEVHRSRLILADGSGCVIGAIEDLKDRITKLEEKTHA